MLCSIIFLRPSNFHSAILGFLLLSAIAVAYYRLPYGIETASSNRYAFYSLLFVIVLFLIVLEKYPRLSGSIRSFIALALLYNCAATIFLTGEAAIRKERLIDYRDRLLSGQPTIHYKPIIPAEADSLGSLALEKGIWKP